MYHPPPGVTAPTHPFLDRAHWLQLEVNSPQSFRSPDLCWGQATDVSDDWPISVIIYCLSGHPKDQAGGHGTFYSKAQLLLVHLFSGNSFFPSSPSPLLKRYMAIKYDTYDFTYTYIYISYSLLPAQSDSCYHVYRNGVVTPSSL